MAKEWEKLLHTRLENFQRERRTKPGIPISIKCRVSSGCFERSCCKAAYQIIDRQVEISRINAGQDFTFEEHESGPEIFVYVAAGLGLAKSIIDLVVAIIKARPEGQKQGDRHRDPIELTVRGFRSEGEYCEEVVMQFSPEDSIDSDQIGKLLNTTLTVLTDKMGYSNINEDNKPMSGETKFGHEIFRQVDGLIIRSGMRGYDLPGLVEECQELADQIEAEPNRAADLGFAFAQKMVKALRLQKPQYGSPTFGPSDLADVIAQTIEHELED